MSDWSPLNSDDDIVSTISGLMNKNREEAKPEVVRITVTASATEGYILQNSIFGEEGEAFRKRGVPMPREILIHPKDWEVIKKALLINAKPTDAMGSGNIGALIGIPVIVED